MTAPRKERHILSLSGGKDSAALAVYMKDRMPEMEYAFCDTGKELPETYEYLNELEAYLGKPVHHLNSEFSFDHWLKVYSDFLPSAKMRWCTKTLKIKPFEKFCGDDIVYSYIGLRADENREGYISTKPNITAVYPFKEDGINKADVFRILEESGVGIPSYYSWRTRSGCYFCFFQRKAEWVGLMNNHPDLFDKAKSYEKVSTPTGGRYTWSANEGLDEMEVPKRQEQILGEYKKYLAREIERTPDRPLIQLFDAARGQEDNDQEPPCVICDI